MFMGVVMANESVEYTLTVTDANQHLAQVEIRLPILEAEQIELKLPVWRTGRYEILDLSKNISEFSVENSSAEALLWRKSDKNTWLVDNTTASGVTVRYTVYANMLKQRVAHIDDTHAFIDASGVFMFSPELRQQPLTVQLAVPGQWRSRSGMESIGEHQFKAKNYDQLVDSPIESGIHEFLEFTVADRLYEIIIWGRGNHDILKLKEAIDKIDQVAADLWQDFPFNRYVYMFHVGEGLRGATEHVNSTIIQQGRFNFAPRQDLLKVLATTAHEFIHTWNVKSYRPAGIAPYDYSKENYSSLYWMVEGSTSYYDDLFLLRAGIYKPKDYFERLAQGIQAHLNKPGRLISSVAASSFDTWLNNDRQFSHNNSVSIYLEGALKSWALDREIRARSQFKYSYDDVQRQLYQRFGGSQVGYTVQDVLAIVESLTDEDIGDFWADYIEGTKELDFNELLAFYGLEKVIDEESKTDNWLGLSMTSGSMGPEVANVNRDSPAWQAGLTVGDELLALDGLRVSVEHFDDYLQQLQAGQSYPLVFFRGEQIKIINITPVINPNPNFTIRPLAKPSRNQVRVFKDWTGRSLSSVSDES